MSKDKWLKKGSGLTDFAKIFGAMVEDDGGSAFPWHHTYFGELFGNFGLTKREEFAKCFMAALMSGETWPREDDGPHMARLAVRFAADLIAELSKNSPSAPVLGDAPSSQGEIARGAEVSAETDASAQNLSGAVR